jgi:hypothetical protein
VPADGRQVVVHFEWPSDFSFYRKLLLAQTDIFMPTRAKRRRTTRKVGRPPAGDRGERVKDYPQVSVRLPTYIRKTLVALSKVRQQPQWRIIVDSVECYRRDLPPQQRAQIARLLGTRRSKDVQ